MVLDRFDVVEVELGEADVSVGGDPGVERGMRGGERRGHRPPAGDPANGLDHSRHGFRQNLCRQRDGPGGEPAQPTERDPDRIHIGTGRHRLRRRRIGLDRTQLRHQVGARDTVDGSVVDLRDHREPPALTGVGAAESLNGPHFPQRVAAIQRQGRKMATDFGKLRPPSRSGKADTVHVSLDVEVFILDPHRVVKVEKTVGQLLPKSRDGRDPQSQLLAQTFETVAAGNG